jgi:NADH-quinone oxidoreductase subunit E
LPDVNKILEKYTSSGDVIPALQAVQKEFGYLSEENMEAIAKKLKVPLSRISGIATFYSMFRLKPLGENSINVCRGTACHVHDSETLLKLLEKKLNIKSGEVTEDGKFSLDSVNCLGACAKAPVMMINEKVYGNLTEKKVEELLHSLRQK